MRIRYIGADSPLTLRTDKIYDVMAVGDGYYRVLPEDAVTDVPETMVGFMASKTLFEIVDESNQPPNDDDFIENWYQKYPESRL